MAAKSHAQVYIDRSGAFRIVPQDYTTVGVGILRATEVDRVVDPSAELLGQRVLRALDGAGRVLAHPAQSEWPSVTRSFHHAMGYRSGRALMADNAVLFVSRDGGSVSITAGKNEGPRGAYVSAPSPDATVGARAADVGQAIAAIAAHVRLRDAD